MQMLVQLEISIGCWILPVIIIMISAIVTGITIIKGKYWIHDFESIKDYSIRTPDIYSEQRMEPEIETNQ